MRQVIKKLYHLHDLHGYKLFYIWVANSILRLLMVIQKLVSKLFTSMQGKTGIVSSVIREPGNYNYRSHQEQKMQSLHCIKHGEILVFLIREWAVENMYLEKIFAIFERNHHSIEVLYASLLNNDEVKNATTMLDRDWNKGPFPENGGIPAAIIICYDYNPALKQIPAVNNSYALVNRNYLLKHKIRKYINMGQLVHRRTNFIHSSDNSIEAVEYINNLFAEEKTSKLLRKAYEMEKAFHTGKHVVVEKIKTHNSRAKVEQILLDNSYAIKKTYKLNRERYLGREKFAYSELSQKCVFIPPMIDQGENYLIIPYYDNLLKDRTDEEIKKIFSHHNIAEQLMRFFIFLYKESYALIDMHMDNIIVTPDGRLFVIDFEFLHKYHKKPGEFKDSYNLAGTNNSFVGDLPRGYKHPGYSYKKYWKNYIPEELYQQQCAQVPYT